MIDNVWLIEHALRGASILLLAALATTCLRSAAWRHLAWAVALVALIPLPLLMNAVPPITLRVLPTRIPGIESVAEVEGVADRTAMVTAPAAAGPVETGPRELPTGRAPLGTPAPGSGPALADLSLFDVWWMVSALLCLRMAAGRLRRRSLLRRARPVESAAWHRELDGASRLGRSVRLLESPDVDVPLTWGSVRPVLLLPAGRERWSSSRRRHVLLHEVAHIERCDAALAGVAQFACALHWFNPLVWFAARRLVREAELAADDRVLLAGATPSSYASDLVDFARGLRRPLPRASAAMARSPLGARVTAILDERRARVEPRPRRVALVLALVGLVVLPVTAAIQPAPWFGPFGVTVSTQRAPAPEVAESVIAASASTPPASSGRSSQADAAAEPPAPARPSPVSTDRTLRQECGESRGASIHAEDDELLMTVKSEGCRLRIEASGKIEYAHAADDILRLARGARLEILESRGETRRRLVVEAGVNGAPDYRWWVDGEERSFDREGRAWFARVLPEIFRATGLDAEARVARILEAQGVAGVLGEIELIDSDYVGRIYLSQLLRQGDLDTGELRAWLELAGRSLGSDYELAETLVQLPPGRLSEPGIGDAFVAAAETIGSDYELRRTLAALLDATTPTRATLDRILAAAGTIGSDYEAAELLIRVADVYPRGESLPASFHRAAASIGSDYELRRTLSKALERPLTAGVLVDLLRAARSIGSDYELAELLVAVGRSQSIDGAAREEFAAALETIGSEHERRRAAEVLQRR